MDAAAQLRCAAATLQAGGVVVHATEGVFGLACDPFAQRAVARVLTVKGRDPDKGLILIGGDTHFQDELATLDADQRSRVLATWPGPVTWLLPSARYPSWITGKHTGQVAVRRPGHTQARALCNAFGGPLVSTSANLSGQAPITSLLHARQLFAHQVDHVLPGRTLEGRERPSEIRSLDGARLRAG